MPFSSSVHGGSQLGEAPRVAARGRDDGTAPARRGGDEEVAGAAGSTAGDKGAGSAAGVADTIAVAMGTGISAGAALAASGSITGPLAFARHASPIPSTASATATIATSPPGLTRPRSAVAEATT